MKLLDLCLPENAISCRNLHRYLERHVRMGCSTQSILFLCHLKRSGFLINGKAQVANVSIATSRLITRIM